MTDQPDDLTPGRRVAWHRVRRGMPQEVLAGLVGRTEDWLSKIENNRAALDRVSVIRALADALGISVLDIIGEQPPGQTNRQVMGVAQVRAALTDYRHLSPLLAAIDADYERPRLDHLERDVSEVMRAYQESHYRFVLRRLPELLTQARLAVRERTGDEQRSADRLAAFAYQSTAMILTKLGEADLAWIAAQGGLAAAERTEDPAVIGSLLRSAIHSLHSQNRVDDSKEMTRKAADYLHRELSQGDPTIVSIYGSLFLPGAVAAAKAQDRGTAGAYLDEAEEMAGLVGADANYLWTAFGPTNVKIHRVTTAMSFGDVQIALDLIGHIDTAGLPVERRVRHALEVVNAYLARNKVDEAITELLTAEQEAPEHVHDHVMSRHLVLKLRFTNRGRRSRELAELGRRMKLV